MTIREIAYSAQQQVQVSTGGSFKRAHIYELLAASFGFNSYAAFGVDAVLAERRPGDGPVVLQSAFIKQRCIELGYQPAIAAIASSTLESFLAERQIGVANISSMISRLNGESFNQDDDLEEDMYELFAPTNEGGIGPIQLDGLDAAASKGNALAHYALALIHAPHGAENEDEKDAANSYWYSQRQQGRVLIGVEKEWADAHEAYLTRAEKYMHHLREAGRLGNAGALLDLAERFDDPSFFEQSHREVGADPAAVAAIAEHMGRDDDAKYWLTVAAERGDTDAMFKLIEEFDQGDLVRCWTWVYLSQLVGKDPTKDAHYAIHEDGSEYDDDVGGPVFVAGRDGIDLEPLGSEQDASAKFAAQNLFALIQQKTR